MMNEAMKTGRCTLPLSVLALIGLSFGLGSCDQTTVTVLPVSEVSISPPSASINTQNQIQLSATPRTSAGVTLIGREISWTSGNELIATVDGNGRVTSILPGQVDITARIEGVSGSSRISVSGSAQLDLAGGAVRLFIPGGALQTPVAFSATPTTAVPDADILVDGTAFDIGPSGTVFADAVTLTLSYELEDLPPGAKESELGLYKVIDGKWERMPGSTLNTVDGTVSGQISSLSRYGVCVLPVATVEVTPPTADLELQESVQLSATPKAADGTVLDSRVVSWSSSDEQVASVSDSGYVTAVGAGTAEIRARSGGINGTASIFVARTVAEVDVSPSSARMTVGETKQLLATVKDANGAVFEDVEVTWFSGDEEIVEVNSQGVISGVGVGSANVTASADGYSDAAEITVLDSLKIRTLSLPDGVVNISYSKAISASGGDGDYQWILSSGSLPNGYGLDPESGIISGLTDSEGTYEFTVQVQSGDGQADSRAFNFSIKSGLIITTNSPLSNGVVGEAYSHNFQAVGGAGGYSWSVISGSLPAGLSLNPSTGQISGIPTAAGLSTFTVQVSSGGQSVSKAYSINIQQAPVSILTTFLPDGTVGTAYDETLLATGGTGVYSWSITSGALPAGLALAESSGVISGNPTVSGESTFEVQAASGGMIDEQQFTLSIDDASTNESPTAAFSVGCFGLTCGFIDESSDSDGNIVSWDWDFGDGTTSTERHPNRYYTSSGTYTVQLTVTDDDHATDTHSEILDVSEISEVTDTVYAEEDASISSVYPNTNFGIPSSSYEALTQILAVGPDANTWAPDPVGFAVHASLVRFDLSSYSGKQITAATLQLRARNKVNSSSNRRLGLFSVAQTWSETSVTWNNQPTLFESTDSPIHEFGHGECWTCTFDVSPKVNAWTSGVESNYGFMLFSPLDAINFQDWTIGFESRHSAVSVQPMLIITYR